jgi:fibronectin type 3 domain-containing protein
LAATGGLPPYTWSVIQGSLPAGLTLDANSGVISGTPTAPGTFNFTMQVSDSESPPATASAPLSITVSVHSVFLSWKASTSQDVIGYNAYRSMVSRGPYSKLNASLISTTNYNDLTVQSGYTYFYVTTAVDSQGMESVYSNQAAATVP